MAAAAEPEVIPAMAEELEQIYRAHYLRVLRTAYRITGRMSDAEDVLQTVFLRLAARQGRLQATNLAAYLHRAAVNAALDTLRLRRHSGEVELDDALPPSSSTAFQAIGGGDDPAQIRDWLRHALRSLSPRSAEMFVLRYVEGYGNREIARMLDTSAAVVAVILHRTRGQLQKDFRGAMRTRGTQ
jgi:RNA polymerase sigma-70 factor, ECF subfamily